MQAMTRFMLGIGLGCERKHEVDDRFKKNEEHVSLTL